MQITAVSSANDKRPTPDEVRAQLRRILASEDFISAPSRAELLQYLVEKALANENIKEAIIGEALVPRWLVRQTPRPGHVDDEPPGNVRVIATLLRKRLTEYYDGSGRNDPVLIEVKRGRGYKIISSYRIDRVALVHYRRGIFHRATCLPYGFRTALKAFTEAVEIDPTYGLAHVAAAETALLYALSCISESTLSHYLEVAEDHAHSAIQVDPHLWEAQLILAFLDLCNYRWDEAAIKFQSALREAPQAAAAHPIYAAYLLAIGQTDQALTIIKSRFLQRLGDPYAYGMLGLFYYAARRYEEAERVMGYCESMLDVENWLLSAVKAVLFLMPPRKPVNVWVSCYLMNASKEAGTDCYLPGLHFLAESQPEPEVVARLDLEQADANPEPGIKPFQAALAYIAIGRPERAIAALDNCKGHPWMAWLHLWPFLDPLRQDPRFQAIIERANFPLKTMPDLPPAV